MERLEGSYFLFSRTDGPCHLNFRESFFCLFVFLFFVFLQEQKHISVWRAYEHIHEYFFTRNTSKLSSYFWQTEPSISDFPATVTWPIVFFVVPIEAFSESGLRAELPADEQYDVGRSLGFLNPQFFFMNYKYYAFFF